MTAYFFGVWPNTRFGHHCYLPGGGKVCGGEMTPWSVDMAAPWVGMRFWAEYVGNPPEWHECEVVALMPMIKVCRVGEKEYQSMPRSYWDHGVSIGMLREKKP